MAWFKNSTFGFILLLATSLAIVSARGFRNEREPSVFLAHKCASLKSEPVKEPPVIMIHGVSDIKEAWDGIYQSIIALTKRRVCIYDARNHGDSGWNDTFDIPALAEDLGRLIGDLKMDKVSLVGHSMGGLTAMKYALEHPDKVDSLFIEDISPVSVPKEVSEFINTRLTYLVDALKAIPDNADGETALKAITDYVTKESGQPPAEFLYKRFPLCFRDGKWQWKMNIDVISKSFKSYEAFLKWYGEYNGQYNGRTMFLYGKESPLKVFEQKEGADTRFPNSVYVGVEGAGHIIHADHPEFLDNVVKFLNK